jgi:Ring finger domain
VSNSRRGTTIGMVNHLRDTVISLSEDLEKIKEEHEEDKRNDKSGFREALLSHLMCEKHKMERQLISHHGLFSCLTDIIVDLAEELTSGRSDVSPFLDNDLQKGIDNLDRRLKHVLNQGVDRSDDVCCICLEDMNSCSSKMELHCKHVMHANCLHDMYQSSSKPCCPICRAVI